MATKRIGEILSHLVPLSGHDIEEILSEQHSSRKRFGDIALAMGMCRPEHIWKASTEQLDAGPRWIDLDTFGVDAQALAHIPAATARSLGVIPVRVFADDLVVAAHEHSLTSSAEVLPVIVSKQVKFVLADRERIEDAIETYYPA